MEQFKSLFLKKPELLILGLLFFVLPFNIRKFLGILAPYSSVVFNEWSAAFFYLVDGIFIVLAIFVIVRWVTTGHWRPAEIQVPNKANFGWLVLGLVIVTGISAYLSKNSLAGYGWIRLLEASFLAWYISGMKLNRATKLGLSLVFFVSISIQALIGLAQFFNQHSLGLKWLGESVLDVQIPNVAEVVSNGIWLRAYGTLPHPNVLGYFLVASLLLGFHLYCSIPWLRFRIALAVLASFQFLALLATFSRISWLMLVVGLVCLTLTWRRRWFLLVFSKLAWRRHVLPGVVFLCIGIVSVTSLWPLLWARSVEAEQTSDLAINLRLELAKTAVKMWPAHILFGTGPRTFVTNLAVAPDAAYQSWALQPAHNVFLLALVEVGIVGLVAYIGIYLHVLLRGGKIILWGKSKNVPRGTFLVNSSIPLVNGLHTILIIVLLSSLVPLLFDHYIWDVLPTTLLFYVILGLSCGVIEQQPDTYDAYSKSAGSVMTLTSGQHQAETGCVRRGNE